MSTDHCDPIAIVGIGCRFPGGIDGPESFWKLLCEGRHGIGEVPSYRWSLAEVYDPRPGTPGKIRSRKGGFLGPVDAFDAAFFGISAREAPRVDPQQRLLLETAWEALEDAGLPPDSLPGGDSGDRGHRGRTGVFLGMMSSEFEQILNRDPETLDMYGLNGGGRYGACGRLSFVLGLEGPSLCVDTACTSSLVSIHLACQGLRAGECEVALAGGSHLILQPHVSIAVGAGNILSEHCKFGDARADGFVRSEGVGLVVLKRLSRAVADGDRIYASIPGSTVGSNGRKADTMASPSSVAQQELLREAYRVAGILPSRVRYIEAHGTGTSAGDRIELEALSAVLGPGRAESRPCLVGSVKTNLGHTEGASGVASVIKLALCLFHRALPPSLHCDELNPNIPWERMPLHLQRDGVVPWPDDPFPAVGGANSFGLSGSSAHIVMQEPPRDAPAALSSAPEAGPWLVALSARHPGALRELARSWRRMLARLPPEEVPDLADLAWTAGARRQHLEHRLALVAASREELSERLDAFLHGEQQPGQEGTLAELARHYMAGQDVDWHGLFPRGGRLVRLPSYPWQRERFLVREVPAQGLGVFRWTEGRHPLLGPHVRLAAPAGVHVWQTDLRTDAPAYLADHRVQGSAVLPAAAYVEMMLSAAGAVLGAGRLHLSDVSFETALWLPDRQDVPVQVVLTEEMGGGASVQVFGREGGEWVRHAAGRVQMMVDDAAPPAPSDARRGSEELSGAEHYRSLRERGLEYGPAFQGVETVWRGEREAVAILSVPGSVPGEAARGHRLPPTLLDACLQTAVQALASADTWLPVGIRSLRLWRAPEGEERCRVHARLREEAGILGKVEGDGTVEGDLEILGERGGISGDISGDISGGIGDVLVEVQGLTFRRLSRPAAESRPEEDADLAGLLSAGFEERRTRVEERLRREVAAVLRTSPATLDESRTLTQLGVDSLMALELKACLSARLGTAVSVPRLLQGSLRQLAGKVLDQLAVSAAAAPLPALAEVGVWEEIEL